MQRSSTRFTCLNLATREFPVTRVRFSLWTFSYQNLAISLQNAHNSTNQSSLPWHCLYFLLEPQGQGSLRPIFAPVRVKVCLPTTTASSSRTATSESCK